MNMDISFGVPPRFLKISARRRKQDSAIATDKTQPSSYDFRFDSIMEVEIETLATLPSRALATSARMREFYHSYHWESRYLSIRHWLIAVALLNMICLIIDYFILPQYAFVDVVLGRFLISTACLICMMFLHKKRSGRLEGLCVIFPCFLLLAASGLVGLSLGATLLERYVVNACFVIATAIVSLRVQPRYVSVLTGMACALLPVFIFASPIKPFAVKVEIALFHVGAMAALWNTQRIQMRERYRGVILSLHNEIQARKMAGLNAKLISVTLTDPLTGIPNRRHFDETLALLAPGTAITLFMIDIDRFKLLNDTFGHAEGDVCLRFVAQAICSQVRPDDLAARFGGEEFVVLITGLPTNETMRLAERIRTAVMPAVAQEEDTLARSITVSIGIASGFAHEANDVQKRADRALYKAKANGRNRVVSDDEDEPFLASPRAPGPWPRRKS